MPNKYNRIERVFAIWLSRFPFIKGWIKKKYQIFNFLFYRKNYIFQTEYNIIEFSFEDYETFFGYYDKSPLNQTSEFAIFHKTNYHTSNKPNPQKPVEVVLFDFKNGNEIAIHKSYAYNWQQGTKCQWLDNDRFIFNDFNNKNKKYCSKIINALTGKIVKVIDFPIYDVFNNFAYSLNFTRLVHLRPDYGYFNKVDTYFDLSNIENDGVFKVDLIKNTSELIIPFEKLIKLNYCEHFEKAIHKVNHIMISPNGDKFIFLHRYFLNGRKYDRLIQSDVLGNNLTVLSDHEMISHCCWLDNDKIVSFMRRFEIGDKYYLIDTNSKAISVLGKGVIDKFGDGHPSVYKNKMIFDTYPNKSRNKELFLYDIKSNSLKKLGEFFESFQYYCETRCDLHPRWSHDGTKVFIDSVHTGKRKLYYLELNGS